MGIGVFLYPKAITITSSPKAGKHQMEGHMDSLMRVTENAINNLLLYVHTYLPMVSLENENEIKLNEANELTANLVRSLTC